MLRPIDENHTSFGQLFHCTDANHFGWISERIVMLVMAEINAFGSSRCQQSQIDATWSSADDEDIFSCAKSIK